VDRWRRSAPGDLWIAGVWTVTAVAAVTSVWFSAGFSSAPFLSLACPFRAWIGLPCASCGSTRAAAALVEGDLVSALTLNPLATASLLAFAIGGLLAVPWVLARGPVPARLDRIPRIARVLATAGFLGNWLYLCLASPV